MGTRRETCLRIASLAAILALRTRGQDQARNRSGEPLTVPFDFAAGRGSLLVRVRINRRAALLIVDTGSSHTVLLPSSAGVNPKELAAPRTGAGVSGDAVGQDVTLELGQHLWQRRVAVMDLSAVLSGYREKIDGLLGLDFLFEFSQAVINLKNRTITFVP